VRRGRDTVGGDLAREFWLLERPIFSPSCRLTRQSRHESQPVENRRLLKIMIVDMVYSYPASNRQCRCIQAMPKRIWLITAAAVLGLGGGFFLRAAAAQHGFSARALVARIIDVALPHHAALVMLGDSITASRIFQSANVLSPGTPRFATSNEGCSSGSTALWVCTRDAWLS
jgi:hypothetical protein